MEIKVNSDKGVHMENFSIRRRRVIQAGVASSLGWAPWAHAQGAYPNRPIKILVPFPPGNTIDIVVRMLQNHMSASLGQSIVVENIGGAGGRIGTAAIVRANPDGYTIGAGQSGTLWVQPHTTKDPSYDVSKDLTRIALTVRNFNVLVRNNNTPFNNLAEMIAWARANPGKLTYGSNGEGGFPHLWFEEMAKMAGIKFTYVPYKGAAQVATDLISGQIMAAGDGVSAMVPYINNNQMKLLAVTNETRVSQFPDAPAVAESLPGFAANGEFGYVGPAKMQPEHVRVLNKAINDAIMSPEVQARLPGLGLTAIAQPPEFFEQVFKTQYERFGNIIKSIGYQPK
jgi:tripartite-type tricarboxylate transporter receptor subunit TctC